MDVAKRRATYADLVAVPDHLVAEIVDGELVTSPRPAIRDDELVRAEPFDTIEIDLLLIWGETRRVAP